MSPGADSAGVPFEGRAFRPNRFAGDDGTADPAAVREIAAFHRTLADLPATRPYGALAERWISVIDALRGARVLSPLVSHAGERGLTAEGRVVDKTQELSVVHLEGPDGRPVAPVFLDTTAMTRWRADARPTPVWMPTAALAAAGDGLALMVVNPGSPESVTLRRGAIQALATGEPYVPAWMDPEVDAVIAESYREGPWPITRHRLLPGDPAQVLAGPEVVVAVGVERGLEQEQVESLAAWLSVAWTANAVLSQRVDGVGIKLLPAR